MKYLLLVLATAYSCNPKSIVVVENLEIAPTHKGLLIQTPDSTVLWIEER